MPEIDPRAYRLDSITRLIEFVNHGEDLDRANDAYRRVVKSLREQLDEVGPKGKAGAKLVLTIEFTAPGTGGWDVRITPATNLPQPLKGAPERLFPAEGDVLTLQDPAQYTMFPRADLGRRRVPPADIAGQSE